LITPALATDHVNHVQRCRDLREAVAYEVNRDLYEYQEKFSDAIIEAQLEMKGDELFSLMARQCGKTESVVLTLITLCVYHVAILRRPFSVGVFAPAQSQAIEVFRMRLRERFDQLEPFIRAWFGVTSLRSGRTTSLFYITDLKNDLEARIRCMSSDKAANIKGETLDLILIEQAEDADESKLKADIFPMAAATGGVRVLNGTSTVSILNHYFYKACIGGGDNVYVVDCHQAGRYNPTYAAFIEKERERLGADNPEFKAQYELTWEAVPGKFIMDRPAFIALEENYTPAAGLLRDNPPLRRTAAWDPARGGDYSWVTVVEGENPIHIVDWWYTQGMNLEDQAHEVGRWLSARGVKKLAIGVIGLGQGPADIFHNHFPHISLERVEENLTQQDVMFKLLEQEIINKRLRYPARETPAKQLFLEQMLRAGRRYVGNKLTVEAPLGSGSHDDAVDSLSMAVWAHLMRRGGIIARSPHRPKL